MLRTSEKSTWHKWNNHTTLFTIIKFIIYSFIFIFYSYTFRSGNVKHKTDKFFDTVVEIYTERDKKFTIVDRFDEFGLADGRLNSSDGPLLALRLRVVKDSFYCAVLSEVRKYSFSIDKIFKGYICLVRHLKIFGSQ